VTILVAEDDAVASEHLCAVLHGMGIKVRTYQDGVAAWEGFDAAPVRIVISDWDMPGLDGPGLCRLIRGRPKTEYVYFILITGVHTDEEHYNAAIKADVDDFLVKPLDRFAIWRPLHVAKRILKFATEMNQLQSLLPICMYCKKIRDDGDYWHQMEEYVAVHTGTSFTHGVCPECAREFLTGGGVRGDEIG
jgi:sigma-B regulation protein RsbU (phosphoserine phosphatase)